MPLYVFTGPYPVLYPSIQDAEGKSLQANPGDEVSFDTPPNDGQWAAADEPPVETFTENPPKKKAAA